MTQQPQEPNPNEPKAPQNPLPTTYQKPSQFFVIFAVAVVIIADVGRVLVNYTGQNVFW